MTAAASYRVVELTDAGPAAAVRPLVAGVCRSDVKEVARCRSVRSDFGHEVVCDIVETDVPERLPGS